jgi:hypothetical protein
VRGDEVIEVMNNWKMHIRQELPTVEPASKANIDRLLQ